MYFHDSKELKIRSLNIILKDKEPFKDPFGMNDLQDRLKKFCIDQSMDMPQFLIIKPDDFYMGYAVSLHLSGKDRWEEFDAKVVYVLRDFSDRENREAEERLLKHMFEELGEPIALTIKGVELPNQQRFFNGVGLRKKPVTWEDDHQNAYEVYTRGQLEMGGFVNLMERIEYIGKEIVYNE